MRSGTHDALDIEGLEVSEAIRTPGQYTFLVNLVDGVPRPCCGSASLTRWNAPARRFRDLTMSGHFVEMVCHPQRYRCSTCERFVREEVPGLHDDHRMTRRLVDHIVREAGRRTFAEIAREVGLPESTARRVFVVQMVDGMKTRQFDLPRVLGIDEKYLFGDYFVVIGDVEKRRYLDIIGTRDLKVMREYFRGRTDCDRVEVVTADMDTRYHRIAEEFFPKAAVVIDKYHVLEMANGAVDRLRFAIGNKKKAQERRWYRQNRKVLLKRKFDIDKGSEEDVVLGRMFAEHPELKVAYDIKERMFRIYDAANRREGEQRYIAWRRDMPVSMTKRFGGVLRKVKENSASIYNYFDHRYTNAYMEGLNRSIGDLHRDGRGYSVDTLRAKLLVAHGGFLEKQPRFKRVEVEPPTDFDLRNLFELCRKAGNLGLMRFGYYGLAWLRSESETPGLFSRGERKFPDMPC